MPRCRREVSIPGRGYFTQGKWDSLGRCLGLEPVKSSPLTEDRGQDRASFLASRPSSLCSLPTWGQAQRPLERRLPSSFSRASDGSNRNTGGSRLSPAPPPTKTVSQKHRSTFRNHVKWKSHKGKRKKTKQNRRNALTFLQWCIHTRHLFKTAI